MKSVDMDVLVKASFLCICGRDNLDANKTMREKTRVIYKVENIKVLFSGTAFGSLSGFDLTGVPAGVEYWDIKLSAISGQ
jgi:hypothetical protein